MMNTSLEKEYLKYVSLNILGMLGISLYILADTFFIAQRVGSLGLAALNFAIPIYSLIYGVGLLFGIGGAAKFSIAKGRSDQNRQNQYFSLSLLLGILCGLIFLMVGIFWSEPLGAMLGADGQTIGYTSLYLRIILFFAPFFICNNIFLAYIRNDGEPRLSMIAMLAGSMFNILMDYVLMYPLGMGMMGAALATSFAPIVSLSILSVHWLRKNNTFHLGKKLPGMKGAFQMMSLGLSSLITELSSAVVLITFNFVMASLAGNSGVASYGIVANIALVAISVFSGIAQGMQPLLSRCFGKGDGQGTKSILRYGVLTALAIAIFLYGISFWQVQGIVGAFNKEMDLQIQSMAEEGIRIYFVGFLFAGINMVMAMYFSAVEQGGMGFLVSILRGCIILVPMVLVLSRVWGITGAWVAFVTTEGSVLLITLGLNFWKRQIKITHYK